MVNLWTRFQERNSISRRKTEDKINTKFIIKGYPSIEISNNNELVQAAVVNLQEKDQAYIYTHEENPLSIGSVWSVKNLHWLVTEEIVTIKDVGWHKYFCFLCNVELLGTRGYFIGPEKKHIGIGLNEEVVILSQQKPMLILPGQPLKNRDRILIKNRGWIVVEYDNISTEGITYYSLEPSSVSKDETGSIVLLDEYIESDFLVVEPTFINDTWYIPPAAKITVATENGYFKPNINSLKTLNHKENEVEVEVPFGVEEFTIKVKQNGLVVENRYKVVEKLPNTSSPVIWNPTNPEDIS